MIWTRVLYHESGNRGCCKNWVNGGDDSNSLYRVEILGSEKVLTDSAPSGRTSCPTLSIFLAVLKLGVISPFVFYFVEELLRNTL
jgi:hypothetical protein